MSVPIKTSLFQDLVAPEAIARAKPLLASNTQKHSCAFCPDADGAEMNERMETASLFDAGGRRKYLTADERDRFITAASCYSPHIEALCMLLHVTGCRISEALALRPVHIDAKEGVVILQTLKQRRRGVFRMMPLPPELVERMTGLSADKEVPLFPWHRTTAWEKITAVMTRAGISGPQACPRGIRHGFGVAAVAAGVPVTLVQRWLGHSRLETTSIYLAVTGPEERRYAERLWNSKEPIIIKEEEFA